MFSYPQKAAFGRTVPKNMIYANAKPSSRVKALFVSEVQEIVWAYKLAPKTVNLPAQDGYSEIEVFDLTLRTKDVSLDVLRTIDKAVPYPSFHCLHRGDLVQHAAAFKRPAQDGTDKWVMAGDYFITEWLKPGQPLKPLPVALNLKSLYEQMMTAYIDLLGRPQEAFEEFIGREYELRQLRKELTKLQARINKEKQFNRKVDANAELRQLSKRLEALTAV